MADKRKLQGEIDRCLKRVQEGVDSFEDTWQKVHNSANTNQKEKYEGDLKKEIKKLQRHRDQIKTWLASSDIKDKRTLTDARKLIETQMERFKVVERETKTKAYSKEGLGAAARIDPAAKEKAEVTGWISQLIANLKIQLDHFESEVEQLSAGNKKKKMDKERHDRYEQLKGIQEKHNFHIGKLETIMRMVDNDALPLDQIRRIREDVEYYVDSNQDPDFEENEFIYDELDLDDIGTVFPASSPPNEDGFSDKLSTTPTSTDSSSPSPSPGFTVNHSKDKNEDSDRKRHKSQEESKNKNNQAILSTSSSSTNSSTTTKVPITPTKQFPSPSSVSSIENNHLPNSTPPPPHAWYDGSQNSNSDPQFNSTTTSWQHNWNSTPKPVVSTEQSANDSKSQSSMLNHVSSSLLVNSLTSSSNNTSVVNSVSTNSIGNPSIPPAPLINNLILNNHVSGKSESNTSSTASATNNSSVITSLSVSSSTTTSQANMVNSNGDSGSGKGDVSLPMVMNGPTSAGGSFHQGSLSDSMSTLKIIAQQAVEKARLENQIPPSSHSPSSNTKVPFNSSGSQNSPQTSTPSQETPLLQQQQQPQQPQTTTIQLNRLLAVAPLGPVPLSKEHYHQLLMEEGGFHHLPHPSDSERLRHYLPRNPCITPPYYPQLLPPHADSVEFFQRLSTETLFFIFYYMEGTKAQYLAAKALKKQSWRFHTKYMMWFQRHEEPKTINEDYEQGTYIYFDYEKWGQRKKEGFTFQYQFLEDRDLN